MPAKKTGRQQVKRAVRTRGDRTESRTAMAKALRSVESGDVAVAETDVREALITLDRAVQKGILHKNNVNRRKSRMAARLNKMKAASA
ncbi:MAG: 30S ribosomal protein S20 [Chloroflexi bacterium]|nr:30S ribosomal protein S20 [Chloroflexota bacterium]MCH8800113.1 30S ribosomal protein S20 [Chloroflexota bacterium]MCH8893259.1 30S ribosomal protein S20 [Chloroflexota bacterium]MCI0789091.1 30S ribosomal protein S20 [Chloroflexota bacterium]MCI0800953.1 30S ribosomal protein S20 [Chloroflexota bacterium]